MTHPADNPQPSIYSWPGATSSTKTQNEILTSAIHNVFGNRYPTILTQAVSTVALFKQAHSTPPLINVQGSQDNGALLTLLNKHKNVLDYYLAEQKKLLPRKDSSFYAAINEQYLAYSSDPRTTSSEIGRIENAAEAYATQRINEGKQKLTNTIIEMLSFWTSLQRELLVDAHKDLPGEIMPSYVQAIPQEFPDIANIGASPRVKDAKAKYQAIQTLKTTLTTNKSPEDRLNDHTVEYKVQKNTLETPRDTKWEAFTRTIRLKMKALKSIFNREKQTQQKDDTATISSPTTAYKALNIGFFGGPKSKQVAQQVERLALNQNH